ncbi:MAG: hypothetical protein AAGD35_14255 [Actinomycetota bacterium]
MLAIYILAAVIGLPLVGYAVLAGDGDGDFGDFGDGDLDVGGGGAGSVFGYLSIGTLSFLSGFFGLTGLALTAAGTGAVTAFVAALAVGLVAAVTQRSLLNYVKRSSSSSHLLDADFDGKVAEVVIPVEPGKRGRISVLVGAQQHYLTAELATERGSVAALEAGSAVVIVTVEGGVAKVAHLDPELA